MKTLILAAFILLNSSAKAQDTTHCRKVRIAAKEFINRKTGKVMAVYPKWVKVNSGYIVKEISGLYTINGKEYKLRLHNSLKYKL